MVLFLMTAAILAYTQQQASLHGPRILYVSTQTLLERQRDCLEGSSMDDWMAETGHALMSLLLIIERDERKNATS